MKAYQIGLLAVIAISLLLLPSSIEAKRRKHKGDDHHHHHDHDKTKTKTKWSTSTDLAGNTQVSTEEHGYYVKRTYAPQSDLSKKRQCPNFLAIPIAWFSPTGNSGVPSINSAAQSLSEGYLCDDDCVDLYEPICGKTPHEVAVFYNKCKLNVAKCRSHGLWTDLSYDECQQTYPKETSYADKKFKASPFYRDNATQAAEIKEQEMEKQQQQEQQQKEQDSSIDSSEEKKTDKNKKDEALEPLVLPLIQEANSVPVPVPVPGPVAVPVAVPDPVAVPVPVKNPVENIVLPPMPVKTSTQGPLLDVMTAAADLINLKENETPKVIQSNQTPVVAKVEQISAKDDQDKLKYLIA